MLSKDDFVLSNELFLWVDLWQLLESQLVFEKLFCSCLKSLFFYEAGIIVLFQDGPGDEDIIINFEIVLLVLVCKKQESIEVILILFHWRCSRNFYWLIHVHDCCLFVLLSAVCRSSVKYWFLVYVWYLRVQLHRLYIYLVQWRLVSLKWVWFALENWSALVLYLQ